jgi:hypothetical protein
MVEPDKRNPTAPTEALASWLAGHAQALAGGARDPAPSIGDIDSWYLGYDVGTRDREEGDDSTGVDRPMTPV